MTDLRGEAVGVESRAVTGARDGASLRRDCASIGKEITWLLCEDTVSLETYSRQATNATLNPSHSAMQVSATVMRHAFKEKLLPTVVILIKQDSPDDYWLQAELSAYRGNSMAAR